MITNAGQILADTSHTFFPPISRLPDGPREAISAAYLSMRAIDQIEDHQALSPQEKVELLHGISLLLQGPFTSADVRGLFADHAHALEEVTLRLHEWGALAPHDIAPRVCETTATMAARMAHWAATRWEILTETDLDRYTFSVAGAVGLLCSDLYGWFDGTTTHREHAVGFGRGLQAVNLLRNRAEDLARGVDFLPTGWGTADLDQYARRNLPMGALYVGALPAGAVRDSCEIPLDLAHATLDALLRGEPKLTRTAVLAIAQRGNS
ncbi:phytoene/squalene synthase family protein [Streptomyces sp. NPDC023838]|uniref:phytoene/squalene synthase family protein n=1 Tax=Streptomyces sp. NPDC023838 TaxID=3154325 RepID=UPI0033D535BA